MQEQLNINKIKKIVLDNHILNIYSEATTSLKKWQTWQLIPTRKRPKQLQERKAANLLHKTEVRQGTRGSRALCQRQQG